MFFHSIPIKNMVVLILELELLTLKQIKFLLLFSHLPIGKADAAGSTDILNYDITDGRPAIVITEL